MHIYHIIVEDPITDCYTGKLHDYFGVYALNGAKEGHFCTDKKLTYEEIIEGWEAETGQEIWRNGSCIFINKIR